jgi:hypothetical protein
MLLLLWEMRVDEEEEKGEGVMVYLKAALWHGIVYIAEDSVGGARMVGFVEVEVVPEEKISTVTEDL